MYNMAKHVGDLFSSSVVAAPATTIEEHVLVRQQMQDPTRGDVARKRRSDNGQRAKCFSCLVKSAICVCIVRDGVQMVLPVSRNKHVCNSVVA